MFIKSLFFSSLLFISGGWNRDAVQVQALGVAPISGTNKTAQIMDEPDYKEYAKVARYLVHKSGMYDVIHRWSR